MNRFAQGAIAILNKKKRQMFNVGREICDFNDVTKNKLPAADEIYTLISIQGGFSSLSIILAIAKKEIIKKMLVTTFRIGQKHFEALYNAFQAGKIKDAEFYTSDTQSKVDSGKYDYIRTIERISKNTGWKVAGVKNHSKVILIETDVGNKYVIETSSNLNENPKIEQFTLSNDNELFNFYEENLFDILRELTK